MRGISKEKHIGQVFTPDYIVQNILDCVGYTTQKDILKKNIIDNSCGTGAFLCCIVERYIQVALHCCLSNEEIKEDLEIYIHGIDNDEQTVRLCYERLNNVVAKYNLTDIAWDIRHDNALSVDNYNGKMDYVVGNPPYVRVHNLKETYGEVKKFKFAEGGMTDLYLVFFEIGFKMLGDSGKMCYITPSSWLHSLAGQNMRKYILQHKNLFSLIDMGHFQPFEGITTYTLISLFSKKIYSQEFDYYIFNPETLRGDFVAKLGYDDVLVDGCFYVANKDNLQTLHKIKTKTYRQYVRVKNGFATLSDKSFIGENIPDTFITIPIIKGSTSKWSKALFPYNKEGKPLPERIIFSDPVLKDYFEKEKLNLLKGKSEYKGWYLYGRSQALGDVWKKKIVINSLVRTAEDLKIESVKEGVGVYSGLYIIGDIDINTARDLLISEEFIDYVKCIKKYKSGGYYTFNSKDVEQFLNYKLSKIKIMNNQDFIKVISKSFEDFLLSGTSRSTKKLKPLHGAIAKDIAERLGDDYMVFSQGYGVGREENINGRYIDKRVDITIKQKEKSVCGIAVKFVMQNYSQNSNNYFENMLGETANIRSNKCPYFQVFIILDKLPYYDRSKKITHWETFSKHNVSKYLTLSRDNIENFYHTPNKTLIYVVHIPDNEKLTTQQEYISYYKQMNMNVELSKNKYDVFGDAVILNNYELFINKVYHTIKAL